MRNHIVYISTGSNIGNKLQNCEGGIAALTRSGESVLIEQSRFYMTEPVDYMDQDWFVNSVVKIETILDPLQLLTQLQSIQYAAGRSNDTVRFGPRILDLDIIFYDDIKICLPELEIPNPRMHKRRFVLKPMCDIDPKIIHPVFKKDMQYLLDHLDDHEQRVVPY
jgi:2-amino-4-hydroxy-6-hydroxymethyldihydropteridine diphosphokinase